MAQTKIRIRLKAYDSKILDQSAGEIVETVTESGLRGRGGAGFPTGIKRNTVRQAPGEQKYIVKFVEDPYEPEEKERGQDRCELGDGDVKEALERACPIH